MKKVKVGVIGCGAISGIYFKAGQVFENLEIVSCTDLEMDKARASATEYCIPTACAVDELIRDPEIEIVMNLTVPKAHGEVAQAVLNAGKSVYNEKPLAIKLEDGKRLVDTAKAKGILIGCAPDTFLGGGHQTARKAIDDGLIGQPIAATAFMMGHGVESWHPNPEFYYQVGGGPMFDMGPYYLTAMINMMGPVKRVTAMTKISFPERTITTKAKYGQKIKVEIPTHVAGLLEFQSGAIGTIITSFDVWATELPRIEIYGTEGSLSVPDPNGFGGIVRLRQPGDESWKELPLSHGYADNSRGVGVADMACALRSGRKHRASGDLAYHVLEIMHAFHEAANTGKHVDIKSTVERPAALPLGLKHGQLDK